ncbi:MAG TPA: SHOCT domain-containing protein [Solirubrobacterales bacterium]|nr:SHOCT domain-containing protein [Solirubrobacterales bacterium]
MTVFADYTFGAGLLTVLEIFLFIAWIWVLITVIGDLFSDHSVSGWGKAGWCAVLILVPFLGVLIYLIARGGKMQERAIARQTEAKQQFDTYVRQTAATASPADELTKLAALRDQGAISAAEFEQAKAKVLVGGAGDGARIA